MDFSEGAVSDVAEDLPDIFRIDVRPDVGDQFPLLGVPAAPKVKGLLDVGEEGHGDDEYVEYFTCFLKKALGFLLSHEQPPLIALSPKATTKQGWQNHYVLYFYQLHTQLLGVYISHSDFQKVVTDHTADAFETRLQALIFAPLAHGVI